jgi:aminomethyltransferase
MPLKRTPLFAAHQRAGARLIDFGGWEMPVQYTSIVEEHLCVRRAVGLFDISHMGEVRVAGPSAEAFLNHTLTNDLRKLGVGQGQYSLLCHQRGGVIDDLYVYRTDEREFLLVVNAARTEADLAWLNARWAEWPVGEADCLRDLSETMAAVAIQGPRAAEVVDRLFPGASEGGTRAGRPSDLKKNQGAYFPWATAPVWVARTGYTGEDGFELVAPAEHIEAIWTRALDLGQPGGLRPCGLGARDTLRTEMGYPLYGHELREDITPLEAGLGFFVALDKGDFIGRSALAEQKAQGVQRRAIAFQMTEKSAPPRPHYALWSAGPYPTRIGEVTSGTQSPSLGVGIGLGYVPPEYAQPGTKLGIEIRGKTAPAVVVKKPIYRKADSRQAK